MNPDEDARARWQDRATTATWSRLVEEIRSFREHIRNLPVARPAEPESLRSEIEARYAFDQRRPLEELIEEVSDLLRTWSVHVTHPRYFGLFNPSVRSAGIVGETLTALYNPQLAVWSHAPAAQELERHTLRTLASVLGLKPESVIASFTSGGAEANLSAVLAALAEALPEASDRGLTALRVRPAIYLTEESHHSFVKIARMSGLGVESLRFVPTGEDLTMDPRELDARIRDDLTEGWRPFLVVGTAGTTSAGAIDPLEEVGEVARQRRIWFHVDAAWGGSAALVPGLRSALKGIETADSVTWDAHKWLSVPMGAGMFFCSRPEAVRRAFAVTTSYMPEATGGTDDPYAVSAQWSRRAIGLKVFMSLAEIGLEGYEALISRQCRMGDVLRDRLRGGGWLIVNETPLPLVCFTHPAVQSGQVAAGELVARIQKRGKAWISEVRLPGARAALRACVTSFRTEEADIAVLLEELEEVLEATSG